MPDTDSQLAEAALAGTTALLTIGAAYWSRHDVVSFWIMTGCAVSLIGIAVVLVWRALRA